MNCKFCSNELTLIHDAQKGISLFKCNLCIVVYNYYTSVYNETCDYTLSVYYFYYKSNKYKIIFDYLMNEFSIWNNDSRSFILKLYFIPSNITPTNIHDKFKTLLLLS